MKRYASDLATSPIPTSIAMSTPRLFPHSFLLPKAYDGDMLKNRRRVELNECSVELDSREVKNCAQVRRIIYEVLRDLDYGVKGCILIYG